jgi:glycine cleavage system transcriptional repressor
LDFEHENGATSPYHIQYFNDGGKMEKKFIMTAFGKDRPGFVADITRVIYENGCNLEDSTMNGISDEFALILLFSGREKQGIEEEGLEEQLAKDCRRLEREKGISAFIRPVSSERAEPKEAFSSHTLHVEGLDQAGIVYKVSQYLADQNINIANIDSKFDYSPESGTAYYIMEIQIEVSKGASLDNLEQGLAQIEDKLNVDITLG